MGVKWSGRAGFCVGSGWDSSVDGACLCHAGSGVLQLALRILVERYLRGPSWFQANGAAGFTSERALGSCT